MSEEITTIPLDGTTPLESPFKEPALSDKPESQPEPIIDDKAANDEAVPTKSDEITYTDSGIFDFMTPERAIELYKRIHSSGLPELEWKFYGRRKPGEQERDESKEANVDQDEAQKNDHQQDQTANTEFDFDEELSDLHMETSIVNESLSLKRRLEPGSDKKTNLSDIMSDIRKETHTETE